MDVLTKKQRSYCMSQIKGKNTIPELILRKRLWKKGWRYRIHSKLLGKPDLIFKRLKVIIFIDGCFWHKCPKHFQYPETNKPFWKKKISDNMFRDRVNNKRLISEGWKVLRFWEHDIKEHLNVVEKKIEKTLKICSRFNS